MSALSNFGQSEKADVTNVQIVDSLVVKIFQSEK